MANYLIVESLDQYACLINLIYIPTLICLGVKDLYNFQCYNVMICPFCDYECIRRNDSLYFYLSLLIEANMIEVHQ